jgi:hypothetical protein
MCGYRGRRPFYSRNAAVPASMENNTSDIEALKVQLDTLQQSLDTLNNRIAEMENNQ